VAEMAQSDDDVRLLTSVFLLPLSLLGASCANGAHSALRGLCHHGEGQAGAIACRYVTWDEDCRAGGYWLLGVILVPMVGRVVLFHKMLDRVPFSCQSTNEPIKLNTPPHTRLCSITHCFTQIHTKNMHTYTRPTKTQSTSAPSWNATRKASSNKA